MRTYAPNGDDEVVFRIAIASAMHATEAISDVGLKDQMQSAIRELDMTFSFQVEPVEMLWIHVDGRRLCGLKIAEIDPDGVFFDEPTP